MPRKDDATMGRLEDHIDWYNRRSLKSQRLFKTLKIATILAAAGVPLCAGLFRVQYRPGPSSFGRSFGRSFAFSFWARRAKESE